MAGNACPPSPAEPWCALWWLRLLFKPSGGSFNHTYIHTHIKTHTVSLCPLHTRHPLSHPRQQDSRRTHTHTHTKEQTDAVTLEMQAKRCRGEKFSLKLENSLFISAFWTSGRVLFICSFFSCLCSFSFLSFFVCSSVVWVQLDLAELESLARVTQSQTKCGVQSARGYAP